MASFAADNSIQPGRPMKLYIEEIPAVDDDAADGVTVTEGGGGAADNVASIDMADGGELKTLDLGGGEFGSLGDDDDDGDASARFEFTRLAGGAAGPAARGGASATLVAVAGRRLVLVFGGANRAGEHYNGVHAFDVGAGRWLSEAEAGESGGVRISGEPPAKRSGHAAALVPSAAAAADGDGGGGAGFDGGGGLVVVGGIDIAAQEIFNDVHVLAYDAGAAGAAGAVALVWRAPEVRGAPPSPRTGHSATAVGAARATVLVFGGSSPDGGPTNDLWALDCAALQQQRRQQQQQQQGTDGGGGGPGAEPVVQWSRVDARGVPPSPRELHGACLCRLPLSPETAAYLARVGRPAAGALALCVYGGRGPGGVCADAHVLHVADDVAKSGWKGAAAATRTRASAVLDTTTGAAVAVAASTAAGAGGAASPALPPRAAHACVGLGGDRVLVFGGWDGAGGMFADAFALKVGLRCVAVCAASAPLPTGSERGEGLEPRFAHAACGDGAGGVLAFGGVNMQNDLGELCSLRAVVVIPDDDGGGGGD